MEKTVLKIIPKACSKNTVVTIKGNPSPFLHTGKQKRAQRSKTPTFGKREPAQEAQGIPWSSKAAVVKCFPGLHTGAATTMVPSAQVPLWLKSRVIESCPTVLELPKLTKVWQACSFYKVAWRRHHGASRCPGNALKLWLAGDRKRWQRQWGCRKVAKGLVTWNCALFSLLFKTISNQCSLLLKE